ncbi:unnamed protein product [Rotaria sp. Silwood2]|nr:unnamed protein product [Rotaria sp. Silwood2]CAF4548764.1 unnamed protein product [Rotaria sp. Silwood2]
MSTYKLYYFNGRSRAEISCLIFAAAGKKYEDIRYEQKLPQSISIARFLAKQFQLAGKDNLEQAKVDAVADTINDLRTGYVSARWEPDETKRDELLKRFVVDTLPKHLQNLEVLGKLYGNGGSFFVSNHLTWVDLLFFGIGKTLLGIDENILNSYQWLKQNIQEVAKQPKIAEYLKTRPKTEF